MKNKKDLGKGNGFLQHMFAIIHEVKKALGEKKKVYTTFLNEEEA